MHREADMIEQQAKQGKPDHNQQPGKLLRSNFLGKKSWCQLPDEPYNYQLVYIGNAPNQPNPATGGGGGPGPAPPQQQQPPQPQQQQAGATQNGGQADYSAQWAEYYRSIGKIKEAEAIEAQMKAGKVRQ